jgi:exonuclease SbcD
VESNKDSVITVDQNGAFNVEQMVYKPQHKLRVLPENDEELTGKQLMKLIDKELRDRGADGRLTDSFDYVVLKVKLEKVDNDLIKGLEEKVKSKDAVLCKIQKIIPTLQLTTIVGNQQLTSIDDILDRDPLETLQEAFAIKHKGDMNERQCAMLKELISGIRNEINL